MGMRRNKGKNKRKNRIGLLCTIGLLCLVWGCREVPEENRPEGKNPYGCEVNFSVPEGLSLSTESDDYAIYYNGDMSETYTVWVWTCYEDMEEYLLSRYSDCRTMFPDNSSISSMPGEETIENHTVKYITASYTKKYEDGSHTFQHIYAGVYLPEGILFEVEGETMDYDGEFGFEKIRSFFEALTVQKPSESERQQ